MKKPSRRRFLEFLGKGSAALALGGLLPGFTACQGKKVQTAAKTRLRERKIQALSPSTADELQLTEGLDYQVLLRWQDPLGPDLQFGSHNDYLAYFPLPDKKEEGLLWVNHEYLQSLFVSGAKDGQIEGKTLEQVNKEMREVGGSIVHIKRKGKQWEYLKDSPYNRRLDGHTRIPFDWPQTIAGSSEAIGTLGNCAGGYTPWGTVLTCEENYDMFYGETKYKNANQSEHIPAYYYGWDKHYPENKPEHYGWVVEVNPFTGEAKKLVALGRCAHECATTFQTPDGRVVVYTGDDANNECLYKFISDQPNSLSTGKLYVANIEKGEWISLQYKEQAVLQENFKDQTDVLIRLRQAADLVGGSKLNRPEDIEIHPITGQVFVSLTNNKKKGDFLGSILRLEEDRPDKTGLRFKADTFLAGGLETGFACPDNLCFDRRGNLWFTSDISGSSIDKAPYQGLGNNALFVVPAQGEQQGKVIRVANAPKDAELTGPFFSPDYKQLFLCVQHPGELTTDLSKPTSHFPDGGTTLPRSCVVVLSGDTLEALT